MPKVPRPRPGLPVHHSGELLPLCAGKQTLPHPEPGDYLEVLFEALSTAGIPKGIVSDGGAIFASTQALEAYRALAIRKERIEPGAVWQNYIETMFNIARRMADAKYAQATSWSEMLTIHQRWVNDYNTQRHFAHEHRQDGCHRPKAVQGWHKGTVYPEEILNRIRFATRYTRHLNQYGYLRFQHWQLYSKEGLAERPVTVWVYDGILKVEYQAVTFSEYEVELHPDRKHLRAVNAARLADTPFRSPQLTLWEVSTSEWRLFWHLPDPAPRHHARKVADLIQPPLFEATVLAEVEGNEPPLPRLRLLPQDVGTQAHTEG